MLSSTPPSSSPHLSPSSLDLFSNLPEEVIASICSFFMKNSKTNLVERNLKKQEISSLMSDEEAQAITIDDLVDIFPLAFVNRTIREKILNNKYIWNENIILDLSEFAKSDRLFRYMNKINDWSSCLSDEHLIMLAERERLKIAIEFLEGLGLAEYIKKLKVSCMLKDTKNGESASWTDLIVNTFPAVSSLVYYSFSDKANRYDHLNVSKDSCWKNLNHVSVYFDSVTLMSLIKNHDTITSVAFSPKFSDSNFLETLSKNDSLLKHVNSLDIDYRFKFEQISRSPLLPRLNSLMIDTCDINGSFIGTRLCHLTKLVLNNVRTSLTLKNFTFPNMKEFHLSYNSMMTLTMDNVLMPSLDQLSIQSADIVMTAHENTENKMTFPKLTSIKFGHCHYDPSFWFGQHPHLTTLSLSDTDIYYAGISEESTREISIENHSSLEIIHVSSLKAISIMNCPSLKRVYIEKTNQISLHNKYYSVVAISGCTNTHSQVSIVGDYCGKLILPESVAFLSIDVKAISILNCYYTTNWSDIIPKNSHNMTLDWLYIYCTDKNPTKLNNIISSFKKVNHLKCTLSSLHTYIIEQQMVNPRDFETEVSKLACKIVTHSQEIDVEKVLNEYKHLHTLCSGSKLNFEKKICSSQSLKHLEVSATKLSIAGFPNLKTLILANCVDLVIDMDPLSHFLEELSISSSTNVKITCNHSMTNLKFFYLENLKNLNISVTLNAPKLREVIIHSIRSIDPNQEIIFNITHAPKLLFKYVTFEWKPKYTNLRSTAQNQPTTASKAPHNGSGCSVL
ncbi:hypothetical protein C9374_010049 [Naegleria lovaniensis]|uniref:Uncharacterized protein n=1 Tax=Naegleria lovaniensis TaxID=51637 RepID=A0AA88GCG1_NAELO|nr:uncharacterized protein C9374_010049 [Naegleria lovaniensis]KAG2375045.1 hypothetical protein C9374_010049 [Naegleria lovaniensis]